MGGGSNWPFEEPSSLVLSMLFPRGIINVIYCMIMLRLSLIDINLGP